MDELVENVNAQTCSNCSNLKPLNAFYKDKRYNNNRVGVCKECQRKKSKNYYYENYEERKKWRENNKDLIRKHNDKRKVRQIIQKSIQRNYEKFRDWIQEERYCSRCNKRTPFSNFYEQKNGRYGLKSHCKRCHILDVSNYSEEQYEELQKLRSKIKRVRDR